MEGARVGLVTTEAFGAYLKNGFDIRPTIAVTKVRRHTGLRG